MVLLITTCTNDHELADDGDVRNVDAAIVRCHLAVENLACQHCTRKYFTPSPLEEAMERIGNIRNEKKRVTLLLQLTLLRNIGELMDRFRAYEKTKYETYKQKIEAKYPVFDNFWKLYQEKHPENEDFKTGYGKLFVRCTEFLVTSMRGLRKGEKMDMEKFLSIKQERDSLLKAWLDDLEKAEKN